GGGALVALARGAAGGEQQDRAEEEGDEGGWGGPLQGGVAGLDGRRRQDHAPWRATGARSEGGSQVLVLASKAPGRVSIPSFRGQLASSAPGSDNSGVAAVCSGGHQHLSWQFLPLVTGRR